MFESMLILIPNIQTKSMAPACKSLLSIYFQNNLGLLYFLELGIREA